MPGAGELQIYPYWNVNQNTFGGIDVGIKASNLSILECKS